VTEIWTIGGGKGGIGKSFILSTMGNYLAMKDKKVVLVDADLGAANLHTFLGISKPGTSLTNFFENKVPLSKLLVKSGIQNMDLLVGAIHSMAPDSIKYAQKLKFFRHIKKLDADYILIDLGAGAHFNTIDTFLLADKMIVVIVPEITAIENMYAFAKNVFLRKLMNTLGSNGFKDEFKMVWGHRKDYNITTLKQLIEHLKGLSTPIAGLIEKELSNFRLQIILNQVKQEQEKKIGNSVKSICLKHFGMNASYIGCIESDDFISRSINARQPYMQTYPESKCAREIAAIADNLIHNRQTTL